MHSRRSCGSLADRWSLPCGAAPNVVGMDINAAYALLAELELHDVEELDDQYFDALLTDYLETA